MILQSKNLFYEFIGFSFEKNLVTFAKDYIEWFPMSTIFFCSTKSSKTRYVVQNIVHELVSGIPEWDVLLLCMRIMIWITKDKQTSVFISQHKDLDVERVYITQKSWFEVIIIKLIFCKFHDSSFHNFPPSSILLWLFM